MLTKEIQNRPFWSLSLEDTALMLRTDPKRGLSEKEATARLLIFDENVIERAKVTPWVRILLNQFKSPLIILLVVAGGVTLFIHHVRDAGFIFAAVIVNAALGFYQEHKAERALAELRTYLRQRARVVRDGVEREIDAAHLVPGDVIRLSQGDRVPADGRLVYVNDVQIDESILTGESLPVSKTHDPVVPDAVLGDQRSITLAGTLVTQGVATALVCRTGFATELGKIAELVSAAQREETPLQGAIRRFSMHAGIVLGVLTIIIFGVGVSFGYSHAEMFLMAVAIAVSAVPEGLPVAMTVILAIGVERMAKRKGVVRRLVAAEALGDTTLILTDKTGTLTMGQMELRSLMPASGTSEEELLSLALMNTNVNVENPNDPPQEWRMTGRTLELSLVRSAGVRGVRVGDVKEGVSIVRSLPFNAVNKFSASLVDENGEHTLIFLGAPDVLIKRSTLSTEKRDAMLASVDALARSGELVLGVAEKKIGKKKDFDFTKDLMFDDVVMRGVLTLRDTVRPSVKDAIAKVRSAGIRVVIMSGDHRGTVEAVAREVGIEVGTESVLDASELQALPDKGLRARLSALSVISRVSPLDKLRVLTAFQEAGEIVAMTGDGVNDAPSVRQADVGIAMGSGTEVTRDVADLVLLDDNFETIAAAVEEGRQILGNIRKVLVYLLSGVLDGLILIGGALLTGTALPLNALQILWVNFFSDSFPAIAFAFEKDGSVSLVRHARGRIELFSPVMRYLILFIGISTSVLLFALYWFLLRAGFSEGLVRTFTFASFGTYSLFLAFAVRSLEKSIFEYPLFSNRYLVSGVGIGIVLMLAAVYVPFLQTLFDTVPLPLPWLLGVVGVGILNIVLIESGKWLFRRRDRLAPSL
ncbi:MAG: HAD-IC family P-type ATPase [Patescibacteria group bacterium]